MKIASLFLSLLVLAAPLRAQPLPGDSVYHLQASTQAADGQPVAWSSLRGQPREAAEAGLRTLQAQGLIGEFQLPDKASFPRFDFLIDVKAAP